MRMHSCASWLHSQVLPNLISYITHVAIFNLKNQDDLQLKRKLDPQQTINLQNYTLESYIIGYMLIADFNISMQNYVLYSTCNISYITAAYSLVINLSK